MPKATPTMYGNILQFFSSDLMETIKQESHDLLRKLAKRVTAAMGFTFDLQLYESCATPTHLYPGAEFFSDNHPPEGAGNIPPACIFGMALAEIA